MSQTTAFQKAIDLVNKARVEDEAKNYQEALKYYEYGIEYFLHAIKYEPMNESAKKNIRNKVTDYLNRAEQIKEVLNSKTNKKPVKTGNGDGSSKDESGDEEDKEKKKDDVSIGRYDCDGDTRRQMVRCRRPGRS